MVISRGVTRDSRETISGVTVTLQQHGASEGEHPPSPGLLVDCPGVVWCLSARNKRYV